MTVETLTTSATEADLEARIHTALRVAFPWLPSEGLKHQVKFAFKFGHRVIEVDGGKVSSAQARADILILKDGAPLAVLELKREGIPLTPDDSEQGLSYARMLHPRPPIVVVTNGSDQVLLETHSGKEWQPSEPSEKDLEKLFVAAAQLAGSDLRHAVDTLMGPGSRVWMSAVRAATATTIADMTGTWEEFESPFVEDFMIPRNATVQALAHVRERKRITIVDGAPLSGKSSVLREIASRQAASEDMAVLFVEADSYSGHGIIGMISTLLADALGWEVSVDDTRGWLVRLSKQNSPALVLAIDGVGAARDQIRTDIEELSGDRYGDNLRLIVAVDDTVTQRLTKNETGRKATKIGRRSSIVTLEPLTTEEFEAAAELISGHRIGIMHGARRAPEYRVPWILRSLIADVTTAPQYANETLLAFLPPLLGVETLARARERFADNISIGHCYRALAEAVLKDTSDKRRLAGTILQSMETFTVRRKTLREFIAAEQLSLLINSGFAKETVNADRDPVVVARLPELLASEMAQHLAERLRLRMNDPREAASWFVSQCARLPLGDVIGAQSLFDMVELGEALPWTFIGALLRIPPRTERLRAGTTFSMSLPDVGRIDFTVRDDGKVLVQSGAIREVIDDKELAEGKIYSDMDSWMILAHLAGRPFVAESPEDMLAPRADPMILMEVGTAPMVLRRPAQEEGAVAVAMHHIDGHGSIVCHEEGIVEPITLSIYRMLRRDDERLEDWIDEAVERRSLPLLARIDIALRALARLGSSKVARWAEAMLDEKVKPSIRALVDLH